MALPIIFLSVTSLSAYLYGKYSGTSQEPIAAYTTTSGLLDTTASTIDNAINRISFNTSIKAVLWASAIGIGYYLVTKKR